MGVTEVIEVEMSGMLMPMLLVVANVMGAGMLVPQAVRVGRKRTIGGVSGVGVGVGLGLNSWWVAYGVQAEIWGIVPVSGVGLVLYAIIAWHLVELAGSTGLRSIVLGLAGPGMVPLPFLVIGGWEAAGLATGFSYGVQFAPAAITALRSPDVSGVSAATWAMAGTEAAIWLVYGLVAPDAALTIGGGGGLFMSMVILVRLALAPLRGVGSVGSPIDAERRPERRHATLRRQEQSPPGTIAARNKCGQ